MNVNDLLEDFYTELNNNKSGRTPITCKKKVAIFIEYLTGSCGLNDNSCRSVLEGIKCIYLFCFCTCNQNENMKELRALFIDRKGKKRSIGNATLFQILQDVIGTKKVTSVAKYRILQMIEQNIPTDIIKKFTGY